MCVCVLACMKRPRLLSLIDPAQHPSDLQDVSEAWKRAIGRKGEERRKIKINSAESITGNLTGPEAEMVKLY